VGLTARLQFQRTNQHTDKDKEEEEEEEEEEVHTHSTVKYMSKCIQESLTFKGGALSSVSGVAFFSCLSRAAISSCSSFMSIKAVVIGDW